MENQGEINVRKHTHIHTDTHVQNKVSAKKESNNKNNFCAKQ